MCEGASNHFQHHEFYMYRSPSSDQFPGSATDGDGRLVAFFCKIVIVIPVRTPNIIFKVKASSGVKTKDRCDTSLT